MACIIFLQSGHTVWNQGKHYYQFISNYFGHSNDGKLANIHVKLSIFTNRLRANFFQSYEIWRFITNNCWTISPDHWRWYVVIWISLLEKKEIKLKIYSWIILFLILVSQQSLNIVEFVNLPNTFTAPLVIPFSFLLIQ